MHILRSGFGGMYAEADKSRRLLLFSRFAARKRAAFQARRETLNKAARPFC